MKKIIKAMDYVADNCGRVFGSIIAVLGFIGCVAGCIRGTYIVFPLVMMVGGAMLAYSD